jgi:hypothetical protein
MRRTKLLLVALGLGALVIASVAVASMRDRAQTSDVAATFTATATQTNTRTCTGQGGITYSITNTRWNGTATSTEPRLNGQLRMHTRTVVNVATGDGWMSGWWRTRNTTPPPAKPRGGLPSSAAGLVGVVDGTTHVDGLATGRVYRPWGRLRANFSALVGGASISGELGANAPVAPDNSAIIFRHAC